MTPAGRWLHCRLQLHVVLCHINRSVNRDCNMDAIVDINIFKVCTQH